MPISWRNASTFNRKQCDYTQLVATVHQQRQIQRRDNVVALILQPDGRHWVLRVLGLTNVLAKLAGVDVLRPRFALTPVQWRLLLLFFRVIICKSSLFRVPSGVLVLFLDLGVFFFLGVFWVYFHIWGFFFVFIGVFRFKLFSFCCFPPLAALI